MRKPVKPSFCKANSSDLNSALAKIRWAPLFDPPNTHTFSTILPDFHSCDVLPPLSPNSGAMHSYPVQLTTEVHKNSVKNLLLGKTSVFWKQYWLRFFFKILHSENISDSLERGNLKQSCSLWKDARIILIHKSGDLMPFHASPPVLQNIAKVLYICDWLSATLAHIQVKRQQDKLGPLRLACSA